MSPRTWGCTESRGDALEQDRVVPTHVGVYRQRAGRHTRLRRCPHARGGVPYVCSAESAKSALSPRTWGCTVGRYRRHHSRPVVPTHVGVYRFALSYGRPSQRCPHARGGVPNKCIYCGIQLTLSPRTWGCTDAYGELYDFVIVVPTHVGVYRSRQFCPGCSKRCPHARGGVPRPITWQFGLELLSPRTWGCTDSPHQESASSAVVPTHVGVYRTRPRSPLRRTGCPHARGGVPLPTLAAVGGSVSSPRTWGCTAE